MNVAAPASRTRDTHLPLIVVLGALGAVLLWFVCKKIHYRTDFSPVSYTPYLWPRRAGRVPRLAGGAVAITAS